MLVLHKRHINQNEVYLHFSKKQRNIKLKFVNEFFLISVETQSHLLISIWKRLFVLMNTKNLHKNTVCITNQKHYLAFSGQGLFVSLRFLFYVYFFYLFFCFNAHILLPINEYPAHLQHCCRNSKNNVEFWVACTGYKKVLLDMTWHVVLTHYGEFYIFRVT